MKPALKLIALLAFAFILPGAAVLALKSAGDTFVAELITPKDQNMGTWMDDFLKYASLAIVITMAADALWFVLGQYVWKVEDWRKADKRVHWYVICAFVAVAVVILLYFTAVATDTGVFYVTFFYLGVFLWSYWLATALFSPSQFKYAPPGAASLRRW